MDYRSFAPGSVTHPPIKANLNLPELPPPPRKHFWNRKFIFTCTLIVLFGGASFATVWQIQNQIVSQEVAPTFTPRATATADWKIYTNNQYGFEFEYQNGVKVNEQNQVYTVNVGYAPGMMVTLCITCQDLSTYVSVFSGSTVDNILADINKSFGTPAPGLEFVETDSKFLGHDAKTLVNGIWKITVFKKGSDVFEIVGITQPQEPESKILDEILSTFKFTSSTNSVIYQNNQYGFSIVLPDSWTGYSVLNSQWQGRDVATGKVTASGPMITLRHPLWTTAQPREDMPMMIFTPAQWSLIQSEKMAVSAAPIPPSVLGQNSKYVITLPARYNYDYKTGWEEVDQLVHTLKAFEPTK